MAHRDGSPFRREVQPYNHWRSFAVCLLVALAVWAVFGQTLRYEFVNYDDDVYVYENPRITRGLSLNGIRRAFTHDQRSPRMVSIDCNLPHGGLAVLRTEPGGHHLTNVLLHAATAILLFLVLRKMTGAFWRSAFVAAVFAIHPLRVESVAWVTERKDVLSGLFFMLTLWAYARYAQKPVERGNGQPRPGTVMPSPRSSLLDARLLAGPGVFRTGSAVQAHVGDAAIRLAAAGLLAAEPVWLVPRFWFRHSNRNWPCRGLWFDFGKDSFPAAERRCLCGHDPVAKKRDSGAFKV